MLSRWQSTIVDERGNVQPLANLTVRNEADQSLAKMWASPGTTQPLPDGMVQADGNGYAFFYARGGLYRITSVALGIDWRGVQIGAALVSIGDYAAGLEITARNQTFWRDGELYRAGAALELPYTTTGDWGDEEGLFVAVGDQALRQELAAPLGAGKVGFEQDTLYEINSARIWVTGVDRTGNSSAVSRIQEVLDENVGKKVTLTPGIYLIDQPLYIPKNTTLSGVNNISIKSHHIIHGSSEDLQGIFDTNSVILVLKGMPNSYVLTDILEDEEDAPISFGVCLTDSSSNLENIVLLGYKENSIGEYGLYDGIPGNRACFDIAILSPSVTGSSLSGVLTDGFFNKGALYLDATRSDLNNGSNNEFNIDNRINSISMCDLYVNNSCFWVRDYSSPNSLGSISQYGIMLVGTDRDIRDTTKYPNSSDNQYIENWIWSHYGTSDLFFSGIVARGLYLDAPCPAGDINNRNNIGSNNGPVPWFFGCGQSIQFSEFSIRHGDIYLDRVNRVGFVNGYGERGTYTITNRTGYVSEISTFFGQTKNDILKANPDGSMPSAFNRLGSPYALRSNSAEYDQNRLFHSSAANTYVRPNKDNSISLGFGGSPETRRRWSEVHSVNSIMENISSAGELQNFLNPSVFKGNEKIPNQADIKARTIDTYGGASTIDFWKPLSLPRVDTGTLTLPSDKLAIGVNWNDQLVLWNGSIWIVI